MKLINRLKIAIITVAYLFFASACSDDAPTPNDERTDKGHGEWYKIEFKFTEGHIHGDHHDHDHHHKHGNNHDHQHSGEMFFHGLPDFGKYLKTVQTYTLTRTNDGVKSSNNTIRLVGDIAYGLEITYYNKKDKVINHEFTSVEMAPIHQHFFIPRNIKSIKEGVEAGAKNNILHYVYRDTEPWDGMFGNAGVHLRDKNDPIGLKGFFKVEKAYQSFDLNVVLVHVIAGSKLDDEGNPYPFYAPSSRVMGTQDLNVKIPVRIFTKYPKTDARMQTYIDDIANEFSISKEDAKKEVDNRSNLNHESGKYKL